MNIIFGRQNAEKLREKYTVLDLHKLLETDDQIEIFCLVPGDKIAITDLPELENWISLHNSLIAGYVKQEIEFCKQCIEHLMGKFGGELDSYYEVMLLSLNGQPILPQS